MTQVGSVFDDSRIDGSSTTLISISAKETAHPLSEGISSVTNEAASPAITATEPDPGDSHELGQEDPKADESIEKSNQGSTRDFSHLSPSAHSVADRSTGNTFGIALPKRPSTFDDHSVKSVLDLLRCLDLEENLSKREAFHELCDHTCIFEKLAGKSRVNDWEWDSG